MQKAALKFPLGCPNADIKKAQALILEAAMSPRTINEPKPECHLTEFGGFFLCFFVGMLLQGAIKQSQR